MNQDTILKRAKNVTFEIIADEAILIDMKSGTYFSLDAVGTAFWEMLDGERTMGDLASEIAHLYNEKAQSYGAALSQLASSEQAISAEAIEEVALEFSLEEEDVQAHLQQLDADSAGEKAQQLVAEFTVSADTVLGDLEGLAAAMQDDNLLIVVR